MGNNYKPEIRFSEFTDAWEQRELSDLANFTKGSGYTKQDLREVGSPIILYGRLYTDYKTLIESVDTFVDVNENSVISLGGEVIVPSSGESAEDISRASVVGKPGIILGGDLNIIKPNEQIDPVFLSLAISYGAANRDMAKRAQGKSVVHLHNSDLKKINLAFPTIKEQRNIAQFNLKLDHLITLHQRKLDNVKKLKAGFLQKMFPRNGERFPEIRFPGFTDAWEQCKLGELVTPIVREVPKPTEAYKKISVRSHAKGTFHQYIENPDTVAMDKLFVVRENDLIVNITFAWEHAIAIANKEDDGLLVSHRFPTYTMSNSDIGFMKYIVSQENFRRKMEFISPGGAGRNRVLSKKDFLNIEIVAPSEIHEQERIGVFFKNLDYLITIHQRELDGLKETKKAFLQKMFV
ncbi:restriction endonuclease subunit S [Paenibacillus polymyxa]|uniref:restriction endonuclease subunit S n=1 Tax=Paenibacillus polymyxa TaxID=1406 RepID=UPI002AB52C5E|nr:restriction endonuclease subunit S [Paenibacillus polymyxa]MDY8049453.1 restriction endonuclease subunit S [Paenibacillus polymyxa]